MHYDTVIIGAGPGGYEAALELGKAGIKTLLVEKEKTHLGGTCLNEGCIPAKNYLESTEFIERSAYFKTCGVHVDISGLDLKQLKNATKTLTQEIRTGVSWLLERSGVETRYGTASFIEAHTVTVDGEAITFDNCIIATGSQTNVSPQLPVDKQRIITSTEVFELESLPRSVTIVGCGAIGCEFATFFNALDVQVNMIGRRGYLIPNEDEDIAKALQREFKKRGITMYLSNSVQHANVNGYGVEISLTSGEQVRSDIVLCAMGRSPYTEGLQIHHAGIALDEQGFIGVDDTFRTSQPHIFAIGDCIKTLALAHVAHAEARIAAGNIINNTRQTNQHVPPSVIFSRPQIASCGINEKTSRELNMDVEIRKAYFKANPKAKILGDDSGFAKIIVSSDDQRVVGGTIVGILASEIIHEVVMAVENKIDVNDLRNMIRAHPTVSEVFSDL